MTVPLQTQVGGSRAIEQTITNQRRQQTGVLVTPKGAMKRWLARDQFASPWLLPERRPFILLDF